MRLLGSSSLTKPDLWYNVWTIHFSQISFSQWLYLFDQKYSNIVKCYYNLK